MTICKHCGHADYAHVNGECVACGCIHFEERPKRQNRQRTWIVRVAFFEKNRWRPDVEVRIKAQGIGGAAMKAVREVKHQRISRRRVSQTRITVVPVPRT